MSKKRFVPVLFMLLVLTVSCSRKEETLYSPGMGGVMIDLTTDLPATKAEVMDDLQLDPDDFQVEVINSSGVIFKRWSTFAEYKSQEGAGFQMNAGGPYRIRAVYGDSTASGFQALFFMGEQEFTVVPQQTTEVAVVCSMGNARLAVEYGENIREDYTDFRTIVYSDRGSVIFGKNEARSGYIHAGELSVYVELTDAAGEKKYFMNSSSIAAAAGDYITLKVDTQPIEKENVSLTVIVDSSTDRKDVGVTLPSFMLPADAPEMTAAFTADGESISFVEGVLPEGDPFVVDMNVPAGIYSLKVSVSSSNPELAWASDMDLLDLTEEQKSKLSDAGFTVPDLYRSRTQKIDFSSIAMLVRVLEDGSGQSLGIKVTDGLGKTADGRWALAPKPASKSISPVDDGNVWARRVYNVTMTTDGNPEYLYPLVKAEGSEEWVRPAFTGTVSEGSKTVTITGLEPSTKYQVVAAYVDNANISEEVREFTTEATQQVENAGFEEWSEWEYRATEGLFGLGAEDQTNYAPYINENTRWWDCNNSETTPGNRTVSNIDYKSFPMVSYVSGRTGEKAAQLMVIAISNTATSGTAPSPTVGFGRIFTGVYGGEQGRSFPSRPDKMKFWYKYSPNDSDIFKVYVSIKSGDTVIGEGTFTSSESKANWTDLSVDITYSRADLKADGIYIEFVSGSDSDKWDYDQSITYGGNKTANVHGGSTLTIDDIELIYE
ncbi:MAG TPA: DUF4493 domain-containing protein [Candidatus Coprenecus stercorigallinarum]|nr:DUF4493 domain-containing protein [Candidatus Coprenecus stercorigallinarum]